MAETLQIEIRDDSGAADMRPNKDLEDFFNGTAPKAGANTGGKQPPPLPAKAGATPPPLPTKQGDSPGYAGLKNIMGQLEKVFPEIAALAIVSQGVTSALNGMTENINAATDALATFAGNERAGLGKMGEAAASAIRSPAESIPIVGDMVKAQNQMTDAVIKLPEKLTNAFLAQAQKIAPYSGTISTANAKSDVRAIVADIREANEMGDSYARMIDAESRLDNTVRELLLPIKKFIVEVLADRLEFLADIAQNVSKITEVAFIVAKTALSIEADLLIPAAGIGLAVKDAAESAKEIQKILDRKDSDTPIDLYEMFFKSVGNSKFSGSFAG